VSLEDPLRTLYAGFAQRMDDDPEMAVDAMRDVFEQWHQGTAEPDDVTYREAVGAPVPATWCVPVDADRTRAIVHTHGGGYIVGSRNSHRKLAGHLATWAATPVLLVDYRRTPESPYPAQVEDDVAIVRWLIESEGLSPSQIALSGDSAGGNIAVTSGLRLQEEGLAPAAIVTMSPWFDLENSGPSLDENAEHDAMVKKPVLEIMSGLYLNGLAADSPEANPLHADLSSLPPILITTSTHETLRDDATRLAARAEEAGRDVTLHLEPDAQHVFQMGAGNSEAADRSLATIGKWLQEKFADAAVAG